MSAGMNNSNFLDIEKGTNRIKSISVDSGYKNLNISNSFNENDEYNNNDSQIKENKDKDIVLEFYDLKNQKSSFQLQSSCLWKIEGQNRQKGGIVQWDIPYRLRHFISGKYLRVNEKLDIDDFENVDNYSNLNLMFC